MPSAVHNPSLLSCHYIATVYTGHGVHMLIHNSLPLLSIFLSSIYQGIYIERGEEEIGILLGLNSYILREIGVIQLMALPFLPGEDAVPLPERMEMDRVIYIPWVSLCWTLLRI